MSNPTKSTIKKIAIRFSVIFLVGLVGLVGSWMLAFLVNVSSLEYVHYLRGYSLARIQGKVEEVDSEAYSNLLSKLYGEEESIPAFAKMFPQSVPEHGTTAFLFTEIVKPYHQYFYRLEVYVCCVWDKEDFFIEKLRLENSNGYGGIPRSRDDLFPLPSLIYKYEAARFLYTLIDEQNYSIHYIYLCEIGFIDNVVFDRNYAPTKPWIG